MKNIIAEISPLFLSGALAPVDDNFRVAVVVFLLLLIDFLDPLTDLIVCCSLVESFIMAVATLLSLYEQVMLFPEGVALTRAAGFYPAGTGLSRRRITLCTCISSLLYYNSLFSLRPPDVSPVQHDSSCDHHG